MGSGKIMDEEMGSKTNWLRDGKQKPHSILLEISFLFKKDFIYLFDRERAQVEGERQRERWKQTSY